MTILIKRGGSSDASGGASKSINVISRAALAAVTAAALGTDAVTNVVFETDQYYVVPTVCPAVRQFWKWQAASPAAWDTSALAATGIGSGYFVQYFPLGRLTPAHGGGKGDYDRSTRALTTDDRAAILWGMNASANHKIPCLIDRDYGFTVTAAAHAMLMPSNMWFRGEGGALCTNSPQALPYFWHNNATNIKFGEPGHEVVCGFGGTNDQTTFNYHYNTTEYASFYSASYCNRPVVAGVATLSGNGQSTPYILSLGGRDIGIYINLISFKTDTGNATDSADYIGQGITVSNGNDGTKPYGVKVGFGLLDGVIMPYSATANDECTLEYANLRRYGSFVATASGEGGASWPPPHPICYFSDNLDGASQPSGNNIVRIRNVTMFSVNRVQSDGALAALKCRGAAVLDIDGLWSDCPHGTLQVSATRVNIRNVYGVMSYAKATSAPAGNAPIIFQNGAGIATMRGIVENVTQVFTDTIGTAFQIDTDVSGLTIRNFTMDFPDFSNSGAILVIGRTGGTVNGFDGEFNLISRTAKTGNQSIFSLVGTVSNFRCKVNLTGFAGATPRVQENTKSACTNDWVEFHFLDSPTGKIERHFSGGLVEVEETIGVDLTCTNGATTLTATNMIPDGAILLGLTSTIGTALGTSGGVTGYQVGISGTTAMYGNKTATGTFNGTTNADWASGAQTLFTSATSIIVTANGGTFDGTGMINVVARVRWTKFTGDMTDV